MPLNRIVVLRGNRRENGQTKEIRGPALNGHNFRTYMAILRWILTNDDLDDFGSFPRVTGDDVAF